MQILILTSSDFNMYPFYKAQIAYLIQDKASVVIPSKYANFADIFSPNLTAKLLKYTGMKNDLVDLVKD